MNGYTIENSIDLLEKDVKALKQGGGGGGASNWNQLQGKPFDSLGEEFHNLDGDLTVQNVSSDKITLPDSEHYIWGYLSEAIEGMNEELGHINGDIIDLTTEVNSLDESKQDTLTPGVGVSIANNVINVNNNNISETEILVGSFLESLMYRRAFQVLINSDVPFKTWFTLVQNVGNIRVINFKWLRSDNGGTITSIWTRINQGNLEIYHDAEGIVGSSAVYNSMVVLDYVKL